MSEGIKRKYALMAKKAEEQYQSGEMLINYLSPKKDATKAEIVKHEICQKICKLYNETGNNYEELAKVIDCEIIQVKQITHSHYFAFDMDFLVDAYDKLINSEFVKSKLEKGYLE